SASFQPPAGKEEATDTEPSPLDCVICFTPFDQLFKLPKELSCGHVFCLECLARINVSSEDINSLTCPVCRAPTAFPSRKGLPGLPTRSDLLEQLSSAPCPPGSVRFDRRRGLLYLPGKSRRGAQVGPKSGEPLNTVSLSVDVGRPAPQGASRMMALSGWPFYVAVAVALLVTIGLITCDFWTSQISALQMFKNYSHHLPQWLRRTSIILHQGLNKIVTQGLKMGRSAPD
uniref:RING-type domain-containing protein n=1 Tax=Salvator merianae TaxID=96440 RepID=A0A8D0DTN8_SALMN